MITITLGKTKKHTVDTSQYMTDTIDVNVVLKDNVDIKAPIFRLNFDPSNYNYLMWAREDGPTRYYWIDNCVYIHNTYYEIHCSLDICATYRSIFRHGLKGRVLYSSYNMDWDEYYDDLRFTPSSLDVYDFQGLFADNWLHENGNILGNLSNLWDVDYENGTIGDGCYVFQCQSNIGLNTYLMSKTQFITLMTNWSNIFWSGVANLGKDLQKLVTVCNWLPIKLNDLLDNIGDGEHELVEVHIGNDTIAGSSAYIMPYMIVINASGSIEVPVNPHDHPIWMDNARWNQLQLYTPSGYTELNLDLMYPRGTHKYLHFSSFFDVVGGTINTKYTYDVKDGWSDALGTCAYQSEINIARDALCLVQKFFDPFSTFVSGSIVGAGLAVSAVSGGINTGSGLAKMKSNKDNNSQPIESNNALLNTITSTTSLATVSKLGSAIPKLAPNISAAAPTGSNSSTLAGFFNTTQLGLITLRLKPFRCRDLEGEPSETGTSPYQKYQNFCAEFGYPANIWKYSLYTQGQLGTFYVYEDAHVDLNAAYAYVDGISDEEIASIEDIARSGFWYN